MATERSALRRVWLLNLDADRELARPAGYAPPQRLVQRMAGLRAQLNALVPPGDRTISEVREAAVPQLPQAVGMAWCPTPRALALLRQAGAQLRPAPSLEVLRRVNHRAFCTALGDTLPRAAYVTTRAQLNVGLQHPPPDGWLLKRPFSTSGSGRRRLWSIQPSDESWLAASFRHGGVQLEPYVERLLDLAAHGYLGANGERWLGQPLVQHCNERGAWLKSEPLGADTLSVAERNSLQRVMTRVADALSAAGYFGPFGVDSFRYRLDNSVRFHPLCEINARYTMGWAMGMGSCRPDLSEW